MKRSRKSNSTNIYRNWSPCFGKELEVGDFVRCSNEVLHYPKNAFKNHGIPRVYNVKSGRHIGRAQEYLINNEWIFLIRGGHKWEIKYVCTLQERILEETIFGEKILLRAKKSDTPWHIALISSEIKDDIEAVKYLQKLNQLAENTELSKDQLFALRGYDQVIRNLVLEHLLGEELWNAFENMLTSREKLARYLSYYFVVHGHVKSDLNEVCHIPSPKPVSERELYGHGISFRAFSADVPKTLAPLADYIEDHEEAIEFLKEIKTTILNHKLSDFTLFQLSSQDSEDCHEAIAKVLGKELFGEIEKKLSIKPVLEKELARYIIANSERAHHLSDQEI